MTETATIYQDRDNFFTITFKKNDVTLTQEEMEAITKFEIRYKNVYYDSDDYPTGFSRDDVNGAVTIKPHIFELPYSSSRGDLVELIIYTTSEYPNGLVWSQFYLIVKKDAALLA